jgi:hypothetical protein
MGVGAGFDPAFIVVLVAGLGLVVAIVTIGSRLLSSSDATNKHLDNATALLPDAAADRADGASAGTLKDLGSRFFAPGQGFARGSTRPIIAPAPTGADEASRLTFNLLNSYYLANISQSNTIFLASLLSMSLGFTIVFVGVVLAGVHATTAIIAAIAGVLSQFIGATFLVVLRSTQSQATIYAQSLVDLRLHDVRTAADEQSVALGLELVGQIADDGDNALANATRASIAMGLIVKGGPIAPVAPPVVPPAVPPVTPEGPATLTPAAQVRARAETITFDETSANRDARAAESEKP